MVFVSTIFLTQFNRIYFTKKKLFAKDKNYKFVSFKNNKLFMKKNEDANATIIDDENNLSKLN